MSDYRKMMLLEEAEVDRLRQKQIREYDPTLSALGRAQAQMEAFLLDDKLSDEEKLMLIEQAQQKFKRLKSAIGPIENVQPVTVPVAAAAAVVPPGAVAAAAPAPVAAVAGPSAPAVDVIEQNLDPSRHADYKALKTMVDKNPKLLRVNQKGEIVFKDKLIPGSSYSDIVKAVLSGRNISTTPGVTEMLKGLHGMHATKKTFSTSSALSAALFPRTSARNVKVKPSLSPSVTTAPAVTSSSTARVPSPTTFPSAKRVKPDPNLPPGRSPRVLWLYPPTTK